jgi:uncharacterized protein (TIGR00255 family)
MRSMTGFGAAASDRTGLALRAEARSVNHKYLQIKVRLPGELSFLEPEVENLVRKKIERGAVSIVLSLSSSTALSPLTIDTAAAQRYQRMLIGLAKELKLDPEVKLETITALPGVLAGQIDTRVMQRGRRVVLNTVGAALDALTEMREREGAATKKDLQKHAAAIERVVARIDKRMPKVVRGHQQQLRARVEELLGDAAVLQPADLAREIALIADRMDVSEELTRLASHLEQLRGLLNKKGPVGRSLDFLVQEFLREANTIGSKCNDARVSHDVVEVKTLIERLREQVQNVE